jgi:CoA:oxalate CoA-transferase
MLSHFDSTSKYQGSDIAPFVRWGAACAHDAATRVGVVLGHLRVIELGQVIAGTFGDMILADLGAEVIKIEPPAGDAGRRSGIYGIGQESAIHLTNNRNKTSVALDLRTTEGRAVLLDLVRTADAVVENFRPDVLERLGIDYDRLRAVNPRIVLVSVSGFGADSPYRVLPAYDLILQAMSGHMSIMGEPDRPPVIMGIPMADLLAGVFSAVALLAAVESRRETGQGAHVDIAMFDVMVEMLAHVGTLYLNTGLDQYPQGSAHPFITPWQAFRCSDDKYIVVAPREEHFWVKLCAVLGVEEISDKLEFADAKSRQAHRNVLLPLLESIFASRPSDHWLAALHEGGVPAAPVNRMPEMFSDKHIEVRRMVRSFVMAGQQVRTVGNAIKVIGREEREIAPPPTLGGDTEDLLKRLLGYPQEQIEALATAGAFGTFAPHVRGGSSAQQPGAVPKRR